MTSTGDNVSGKDRSILDILPTIETYQLLDLEFHGANCRLVKRYIYDFVFGDHYGGSHGAERSTSVSLTEGPESLLAWPFLIA